MRLARRAGLLRCRRVHKSSRLQKARGPSTLQRLAVMLHHPASRGAWGCLLRRPPQEEDRGHTIKRVSTERLSKATWANITASRCKKPSEKGSGGNGPVGYRA
jgi:hypothetical protein